MRILWFAIALATLSTFALRTGPARAQDQDQVLPAQVLVVLAKEEAGSIDATLKDEPALRRPPFNSFRSMKVLSKPEVSLRVKKPEEVTLPNGRKLRLSVERVLPDDRYRVKVSINRPDQNDYLPLLQVVASRGDPFFVAGQSHKGGTLVIGVRIGQKPSK
ncbi:MAG: hypothetical protein ACODAG_09415 [Myxococcota bacterium]